MIFPIPHNYMMFVICTCCPSHYAASCTYFEATWFLQGRRHWFHGVRALWSVPWTCVNVGPVIYSVWFVCLVMPDGCWSRTGGAEICHDKGISRRCTVCPVMLLSAARSSPETSLNDDTMCKEFCAVTWRTASILLHARRFALQRQYVKPTCRANPHKEQTRWTHILKSQRTHIKSQLS